MSAMFVASGWLRPLINALRGLSQASLILAMATLLSACLGDGSPSSTPLSIVTQPADASVVEGSPASFTVDAAGSGTLSYQWRRDGADIPGASAATYTIAAAGAADDGASFSVLVSDANGSVASTAARLSVTGAPVAPEIVVPPASRSAVDGETVQFSVTATGTSPLSYVWQLDGNDIPGETSATLNWQAALADDGSKFRAVVSNAVGSATSGEATLTVSAAPLAPQITSQPQNASVVAPAAATFSVAAIGTALAYQWQRDGADIAGANAATYTTPPTTIADDGAKFSVLVTGTGGSVASTAATLSVQVAPVAPSITGQPADQTVEQGQTATFSVVATGTGPITYQWRRNGVNIFGANAASYTTPPTLASTDDGAKYSVVVTNAVGGATSNDATLTVTQTLLACSGGSQSGWCWINPKPQGNTLRDVQHLDGDTFVAVGGAGTLMRSTDNGANWSVAFALGGSVNAVHFVDPMLGYAVGPNGFIARTEDGGQSWTPQTSGITTALNDVHFVDAGKGLAVGENGTILQTVNGGASWSASPSPVGLHLYAVHHAGADFAVAAGRWGVRLRSADGGASWTRVDSATCTSAACDLMDVSFVDANTGFAVGGSSNHIMRTLDAGLTWTKLPVAGGSGPLEAVDFSGSNGIAVASAGWTMRTADGGQTWTKVPAGGLIVTDAGFYGVAFGNGSVAVAAGGRGEFWQTADAGTSWSAVFPQDIDAQFFDVHFVDASTVYAIGSTSYRSDDGGLTWLQDGAVPAGARAMTSTSTARFTAGGNSTIFRSTDDGASWSLMTVNLNGNPGTDLRDIYFVDSSIGFAVGNNGLILRTADGGLNWNIVRYLGGNFYAIYFYDNQTGVAIGASSIVRSVDGGLTWNPVTVPPGYGAIGAAYRGGIGIAVDNGGEIFRSSDGQNWQLVASGTTENLHRVGGSPGGTTFTAVSVSGRMLRSTDGTTWVGVPSPVSGLVNAVEYFDDQLGLAVGDDGIILRTTTGGQ